MIGDKVANTTSTIHDTARSACSCNVCNSSVPLGSKFCPSCGSEIIVTPVSVCVNCGVEVDVNAKFCPCCGTKIDLEIKHCPKCGIEVQNEQKFCLECGERLENLND